MRIAVQVLRVKPDRVDHGAGALPHLLPMGDAVHEQRLGDDVLDEHAGVQGRVGVLEHDLHVLPHEPEPLLIHSFERVRSVELRQLMVDRPQLVPAWGAIQRPSEPLLLKVFGLQLLLPDELVLDI